MDRALLDEHLKSLANVGQSNALVVSCYLGVNGGAVINPGLIPARREEIRSTLLPAELPHVEGALDRIETWLRDSLETGARGVAAFAREGADAFFIPLQFRVPVRDRITVDRTPSVFDLVELKDTFERYVLVTSTERTTRIHEVNFGRVIKDIWLNAPEQAKRIQRGWAIRRYDRRVNKDRRRFQDEMIQLIEGLVQRGRPARLVLAGDPALVQELKEGLPKRLLDQLLDIDALDGAATGGDVTERSLNALARDASRDATRAADRLVEAVRLGGRLAAVGVEAATRAMESGRADRLVVSRSHPQSEALVKVAARMNVEVEFVGDHERFGQLGGAGCLLRYSPVEY